MKWYDFKDKLPEIGTNILITNGSKIGIIEFSIESRRAIIQQYSSDPILVDFYDDDPSLSHFEIDISCATHWAYPSSIKLPKK